MLNQNIKSITQKAVINFNTLSMNYLPQYRGNNIGIEGLKQIAEHDSRPKKLKFEEKYTRFTNYLRNDLYEKLIDMKYDDQIRSIIEGINDVVAEYIDRYTK